MRLIIGIALMLVGIGTLSCRVDSTTERIPPTAPASQWVRTSAGWERTDTWHAAPVEPPQLHPLVVAAGQVMASLLGLAYFRREDQ